MNYVKSEVHYDGDWIGASADTPDGPGEVVALQQVEGATCACFIETDTGHVWSLAHVSTLEALKTEKWERLR